MASPDNAQYTTTSSCIHIIWQRLRTLHEKSWCKLVNTTKMVKKLGQDDPRRVIHSFKVGLALVLISILQHLRPTFYAFGDNILWAVFTVALVLEFSVGATLGKGLNRILATWLAGAVGVGTRSIANLCGEKGEAVLTSIFVFVIGGSVTFMRFSPGLKARYDYGFIIFILTFCMISLSDDKEIAMLKVAQERLLTTMIGSFVAVTVSISICPVWIGQDLHYQIAANMENMAHFFEGFSDEYLKKSSAENREEVVHDRSYLNPYKTVLSSKSSEETMAVLARWEPGHGRFRFRHPWKQYLKIGNLIRLCAYNIQPLILCLPHSHHQRQRQRQYDEVGSNNNNKIKESCSIISSECGKTLKELSLMVKDMTISSMAHSHVANAKNAIQSIQSIIQCEGEDCCYEEIIQVSKVASLLMDVVNCIQNICEGVDELASLAKFQPSHLLHHHRSGTTLVQPVDDDDESLHYHVISIIQTTPPILQSTNHN